MRIAFFGGSFNPPTYAHINIAKETVEKLKLDKFFFVPVGNLYNKPNLIDEKNRYEMLKIACKNEKNIFVEDIELGKTEKLSTMDAFNLILSKYKKNEKTEIFFVMGADNFIKLPKWDNALVLAQKYKYIIFERNDINLKEQIKNNKLLYENKTNFNILKLKKYYQVNSGIIRDLIKSNNYEECKKYTKPEVLDYIRINKLY